MKDSRQRIPVIQVGFISRKSADGKYLPPEPIYAKCTKERENMTEDLVLEASLILAKHIKERMILDGFFDDIGVNHGCVAERVETVS